MTLRRTPISSTSCGKPYRSDEFLIPHINNWSKVWRITDGSPVGTRDYNAGQDTFNNYMDLMKFIILEAAKMHPRSSSAETNSFFVLTFILAEPN
jgi:hypothetical protein